MTRPTLREQRIQRRQAFIGEDHLRVLQRLYRLRVATSSQLHRLCDPFVGTIERNTRKRLERMEKHGLVKSGLLRPQRGAYSPLYYQLAFGGLTALERPTDKQALRRPTQHVLEYLILRNELYATARDAGWRLGSPILVPAQDHARYLALYVAWAKRSRQRYLEQLRRDGAGVADLEIARLDYERVEKFAPSELTFDFLLKLGADGVPEELVLLIVDDPRRSIRSQVASLPAELHPGMRLILRDHLTRYDLTVKQTYKEHRRLHEWKLALAKKYTTLPFTGSSLLDDAESRPLFPSVWAIRTAAPKLD